jgi:hypothetical protein
MEPNASQRASTDGSADCGVWGPVGVEDIECSLRTRPMSGPRGAAGIQGADATDSTDSTGSSG